MALLPTGHYRIESVPSRLYATADGVGRPILAPTEDGGLPNPWLVVYDKTENTHTIQFVGPPEELGWHYSRLQPDQPITLASPSEFHLDPVDGDPYLFNVRPTNHIVGVDICVGVLEGPISAVLALKYFLPGDPTKRPAWRFILSPTK